MKITNKIKISVEVNLIPFQILYTTSSNDEITSSSKSAQYMQILTITRQHLIDYEFVNHRGFSKLTLYQTVRSSSTPTTGTTNTNQTTLIAYTGTATYNDDDQHFIDQDMMYMCFLGVNGTTYITALQQAGWTTLQDIELMTMAGNNVYMNENGTSTNIDSDNKNSSQGGEATEGTEESSPSSSSEMNNNMQTYIYLIAVCIPVGIVFLCGLCYIVYMLKYNVQWTWNNTSGYDENNKNRHHPIWVVHTNNGTTPTKKRKSSSQPQIHHSSKLRNSRTTLDFTDINDPTNTTNVEDDCCSDELTFDDEGMMDVSSSGGVQAMAPSDTFIPVVVTLSSSDHHVDRDHIAPLVVGTKQKKQKTRVSSHSKSAVLRIVGVEPERIEFNGGVSSSTQVTISKSSQQSQRSSSIRPPKPHLMEV